MPSPTVIRTSRGVKPATPSSFTFTQADVRRVSERLAEPGELAARRLRAWEAFRAGSMPDVTQEAWRRTDIRSLPADQVALRPCDDIELDAELRQPLAGEENAGLLVVRPGHDSLREIDPRLTERGVVFTDLAGAIKDHPDILEAHLGRIVEPSEGWFASLAASLAGDGVLIYVPDGVALDLPLHSILWSPGTRLGTFSRVVVLVGRGASLTYVHETASPTEAEGQTIHAGTVEISVGDGAKLTFVELQNWGEHVWNFTHERARVGPDANLDWIFGAVGSHLTKNFSELDLVGEGSTGRMSGFYIAGGTQHFDHDTQQNHRAPNTTSDLLFKGALTERSRSVWQGMIYVAPGAQKTDGYQANRNLILSRQARADSIPGLEILADDVRCTHGATVGQLEEEPVFYLMSRGLPRPEAERLVVDGFFAPIMTRIPFEGVRERFAGMIDSKLGR
jgi:Fe-S cluster assembly protein SufD